MNYARKRRSFTNDQNYVQMCKHGKSQPKNTKQQRTADERKQGKLNIYKFMTKRIIRCIDKTHFGLP